MKSRASSLMIGSLTLVLIAGGFSAFLGIRKYTGNQGQVPLRVIFEGSASGLSKGGSVNFDGIRVGEVVSLTLDNPRRVVALARIDATAPIRKDTEVGLEFQGLTGVAAISLIGGAVDGPPVPLDKDGVAVLTADPDALLDVQEKIRVALRNIDRVIKDNQVAVKDTLLNFETFTASLAGSGRRITDVVDAADDVLKGIDGGLGQTEKFLAGLGSAKYGGDLLPTVISLRELIQSFDKRSGILMADTRRMLQDVSQSIIKADQKLGGRPPARR
ncbi:MlaD family protein [Bradyrhizobium sp.]|uniref:MlaD family protein n=1 Tax=Bradyrhizobium sp. TaxID=376 RepID=UPI000A6D67AA|nr:MlaD family protein [Bradyrhizobium sp.]